MITREVGIGDIPEISGTIRSTYDCGDGQRRMRRHGVEHHYANYLVTVEQERLYENSGTRTDRTHHRV